jgi:type II secretory pathway pseudopilin PulG
MQKVITYSIIGILLAAALIAYLMSVQPWNAQGSVIQGNEYQATSTAANALYGARTDTEGLLKTGYGSLAQVTITGANTGILNFYNATTSNVNLRTGNTASSSILIASFPASAAAGTYTFDATVTTGLLYVLEGGNMPTTTIMWR